MTLNQIKALIQAIWLKGEEVRTLGVSGALKRYRKSWYLDIKLAPVPPIHGISLSEEAPETVLSQFQSLQQVFQELEATETLNLDTLDQGLTLLEQKVQELTLTLNA